MRKLLIRLFGIRQDEIERILVLLGAASFLGLSLVMFYAGASAIFLSEYSTDLLPHVYIVNAILAIGFSVLYSTAVKRVSFLTILYWIAGLLAGSAFLFWLGLVTTQAPWLKFMVMVWYRLLFIFSTIGFWETSARLLNIHEAKRLFTVLAAGLLFTVIIGGALTGVLVNRVGATGLLLLSAISMSLYLLRLVSTLHRYKDKLQASSADSTADIVPREILQNRYVILIFLFKIVAVIVSQILEFIFYRHASLMYPNENALAGFIGIFMSVVTLFTVLFSALVVGRFIARYGLRRALPFSSATLSIGSAVLIGLGLLVTTASSAFFWFLALLRLVDGVLYGAVTTPVIGMLFQPLKAAERVWVRVQTEGQMGSIALGISGVMLLIFQLFPGANTLLYVALLLVLALAWLALALQTYQGYATTLRQAVTNVFWRHSMLAAPDSDSTAFADTGFSWTVPMQPDPAVAGALSDHLNASSRRDRLSILRTMNRAPEYEYEADSVELLLAQEATTAAEILAVLVDCQLAEQDLLARALDDELNEVRERVFRLLALIHPAEAILGAYDTWQRGVRYHDSDLIGYALEGLFVILTPQQRSLVLALLEMISNAERLKRLAPAHTARTAQEHYRALLTQPTDGWAGDWTRACATRSVDSLPPNIETTSFPVLEETINPKDKAMASIIDRVTLLRTVSIFSQTADSVLADVARIMKERTFQPGETIINKQEIGNRMYIMIEGKVRVHDGDQVLSHLSAPDIFGELSVLDAEPRSASVTTETPVHAFTLDKDALYQLMSIRPEIMEGIVRVLCERIRTQNTEVTRNMSKSSVKAALGNDSAK